MAPNNRIKSDKPLMKNISEDLSDLYTAVGFVVVQWGQAEQSLDLAVSTLYQNYHGASYAKRMPKMLAPKLEFIKKCLDVPAYGPSLLELAAKLSDDFECLSEIRHVLIHGTISEVTQRDGVYSYIKLNVQKDTHEVQEFQFDLKQFPALSDKLVELGAASVEFARLVWDHRPSE